MFVKHFIPSSQSSFVLHDVSGEHCSTATSNAGPQNDPRVVTVFCTLNGGSVDLVGCAVGGFVCPVIVGCTLAEGDSLAVNVGLAVG